MAKTTADMIKEFGIHIGELAGDEVREQVIAGSEAITPKTKPDVVSLWMKGAVDRLDTLADETTAQKIMETCGENCAWINHKVIERARDRRLKFKTEEDFVAAELKKPGSGTRLERDGNNFFQYYMPANFSHPMRCFCALFRGLPEDQVVSKTYCQCSQAFIRTLWSEALGRPVKVEVLESVVNGGKECKFRIEI
ncbi:MAG: hypothetical protein EHM41_12475 [Chloroflexi bacterium]|nr:MAG: hypothetical protein EHM41_12475 [Chloroflexota bacterium]